MKYSLYMNNRLMNVSVTGKALRVGMLTRDWRDIPSHIEDGLSDATYGIDKRSEWFIKDDSVFTTDSLDELMSTIPMLLLLES